MNDNLQDTSNQPTMLDPREERRARRQARRESRSGGSWIIGSILVALGIVFLFQNMGTFTLDNWWALFILIPILGVFEEAWRSYKKADGHLTKRARGLILVGLVLVLVMVALLLEISWKFFGPLLLILAGIGILINMALPGGESE
jgi:peptidoglycan/LPS O-acetylase OafA/YrhL